jgi:hypothetical protein
MGLASPQGMSHVFRFLGVCLAVLLLAARVEAASVTLAWDPNSEADLARYYVGYRTSPSGAETLVNVGNVTTWTLTTAAPGSTYYFRIYAENTSGLRSAPSSEVSTTISTIEPPPSGGGYTVERARLSFGAVKSGATVTSNTPGQRLMVTRTSGSAAWTATTSNSWLRVSPASGTGTAPMTVTIAAGSLNPGTYDGTLTVRPTGTGVSLNVTVRARVYAAGSSAAPGGYFDTPTDGVANVAGAIPVTGWAIDDVGVARVDIYRDPVAGEPNTQIYVGAASFIAGSRPDIEPAFSEYPLNYRGGWGFLVLTNMLPDLVNNRPAGGNGAFRLHAYAVDVEGLSSYLGSKRFTANNAASSRPFGSLDTPAQGGTASGNSFAVFGWALAPRSVIPTNGSTINVYVDGVNLGHPVYNNNRADISGLFPGYANSNGAIGYYILDTTRYANGLHTISWVVSDSLGNSDGIGSRFFNIENTTGAMTAAAVASSTMASGAAGEAIGQTAEIVSEVPADYSAVEVAKVASDDSMPEMVYPEWSGEIRVRTRETEQVEVRLASFDGGLATYQGYVVIGGRMRSLPVGSSLNPKTGVFTWQPGPGFIGHYQFVFIRTGTDGFKTRIPVDLKIAPKHDGEQRQ